ncbi:RNA polymerase sigma factor [Thermoproteota archaeon]
MQGLTDEQVMLAYQEGNVLAMDEILKRYKNPIFHFSYRLLGSYEEAQEVAQEVFFKVHLKKEAYRVKGKFSTWIFTIAHNLCISLIRRRKWILPWPRQKDQQEAYVDFPSSDPSPEEKVTQNELQKAVKLCIDKLPFLQKEALVLREYHKMPYEDIAQTMKRSINTIKSLVHRARMNLKEDLLPIVEEVERGQR